MSENVFSTHPTSSSSPWPRGDPVLNCLFMMQGLLGRVDLLVRGHSLSCDAAAEWTRTLLTFTRSTSGQAESLKGSPESGKFTFLSFQLFLLLRIINGCNTMCRCSYLYFKYTDYSTLSTSVSTNISQNCVISDISHLHFHLLLKSWQIHNQFLVYIWVEYEYLFG